MREPGTRPESVLMPAPAGADRTLWRDAAVVALTTGAAAAVCIEYDVSEVLRGWTAPWERFQLDELPAVMLVLAAGLVWFAVRRYRNAGRELMRRQQAERQLAAALQDNRRLSQQYVQLQEAERKVLARELHDELGQYLNVIKLDAVGIREEVGVPALRERAEAIVVNCDHIHGSLAALIRQLRPVGLDELGLAAALEHCTDTWRARLPGMRVELAFEGELHDLSEAVTVTVYRLVQEALTNVAKHAAAKCVRVRLQRATIAADGAAGDAAVVHDAIVVTVADDGVGADTRAPTRGLGLIGMRERVAALAGELVVKSESGGGFALTARIPVHPDAD